ncbi:hypothetical protein NE237_032470 [Protea cynaroides]|uniref:AAA+ ATPase domain-containing protein n=1 Tax=Protea cynaroides TaxID=273540 RepID=A0A9Q0L326_9MAGN|nr:hypothetical protein NE237_032470 [Protea cynaroides]
MFDLSNIPSMSTTLSTYASFFPYQLHGFIIARLQNLFNRLSSSHGLFTVIIGEYDNGFDNEVFEAAEIYLRSKISSCVGKIRVSKTRRDKNLWVGIERDQEIIDVFHGVELKWKLNCIGRKQEQIEGMRRSFELNFRMKHRDMVLESYLPFVLTKSKLYSNNLFYGGFDEGGAWTAISLEHPATFNKLAIYPEPKKKGEFYKKVGKAWKRGYLLYGPPGTGKSSLIAAMANYLNFNIYDLELSRIHSNSKLPGLFLTLSGLLNLIDGLWWSCGNERIIVFTTNHKERLHPALLRPGRMDMHIHMSYCTPPGFKLLASNYLGICDHPLFKDIEGLIEKVEVIPAEVAEQLMKSDDVDITLQSLIEFIRNKKEQLVVEVQEKSQQS